MDTRKNKKFPITIDQFFIQINHKENSFGKAALIMI